MISKEEFYEICDRYAPGTILTIKEFDETVKWIKRDDGLWRMIEADIKLES